MKMAIRTDELVLGFHVVAVPSLGGAPWSCLDHTIYVEDRGDRGANEKIAREAVAEVARWRATLPRRAVI